MSVNDAADSRCMTVGDLLDTLAGVPRDYAIKNDFECVDGYSVTVEHATKEVLFW